MDEEEVSMKNLRSIALFVAIMMVTTLFAGCGSANNEQAKSEPTKQAVQKEEPKKAESDTKASGTTEVTLWTWSPIPRTMEKMLKAFEKSHPNIKVNYTNYNYSPEYLAALASGSASNSLPDIIGLQPGSLTQQYRTYLSPLEGYAEKSWGAGWKDKFYKVDVDQLQLGNPEGDKGVYIMPIESQVINIWYNKTMFDKLGLKVPTTWDEFISVSKALTKAGYAPLYQGAADGWQNVNVFLMLASQTAPGDIYAAEDGKGSWTTPGLIKAMEKWQDMFKSGITQVGALSNHAYPDGVNLFTAGKVGMMALGSWWMQEYTAEKPAKTVQDWVFDNFYLPAVEAGGKPSPAIGGVDFGYGITNSSKNKDAAWEVLKSFAAEEGIQEAVNDLNNLAAFKGVSPSGNIPESIKSQVAAYSKVLDGALNQRLKDPKIENALQNALSGVAAGQLDSKAALESVQKANDEVLKK